MSKQTVLHPQHLELGARMVDFGGWDMPLHYGSQIDEHHAVRRDAGMFDVSHMVVVDLHGSGCRALLGKLLANDIGKLKLHGKALYSCMLNERGGVIDDLIVYYLGEEFFRLVVNAATADEDLAWIRNHAEDHPVEVRERDDLAIIAVQGPQARDKVIGVLHEVDQERIGAMKRFHGAAAQALHGVTLFVARTGYTGEDGFEILIDQDHAAALWNALRDAGVKPAGLGARDTLRLEAGMNLNGQDMDQTTTPLEAGLGWTVALDGDRDFIGRDALVTQQREGVPRQMVGLVLEDKGVLRHGQEVHAGHGSGVVLSGSVAPTLGKSIGLARLPSGETGAVEVEMRGRRLAARVVKVPFVRNGKSCIEI